MLDKLLQTEGNVLLELSNTLDAEGMRDGLALSSVFDAVSGIEDTALNGDKGIVVVATVPIQSVRFNETGGVALTVAHLFVHPPDRL